MPLSTTFVRDLQPVEPRAIMEFFVRRAGPKIHSTVEFTNEIRPADLFCYLGARFGPPNGVQNFLRGDHSDNWIHWDWTLRHDAGVVMFLGMNFRTEVNIFGIPPEKGHQSALIEQIKSDFPAHGSEMGQVRSLLEQWTEFVNPYQRVRLSVTRLMEMLDHLELHPDGPAFDPFGLKRPESETIAKWEEIAANYTKAFGLCFGIRSMLPVMAEAFVNLLLYVLLRPEIRSDQRLTENVFRQPIDVRVKSLSINCIGFKQAPDYAADPCKAFHRLVNERNDLLHGNVVVDKLKFNDLYFLGKVPVFKEYRTMWERSLQVEANTVGLDAVRSELATVESFIEYLLSCLDEVDNFRATVEKVVNHHHLGLKGDGTIGVLFSGGLMDARIGPPASPSNQQGAEPDTGPSSSEST